MRETHAGQAERTECKRHFVAMLAVTLGFNGLFALIHTLGANSSLGDAAARLLLRGGFLAVGAMFVGAYVIGYQYTQRQRMPFVLAMLTAGAFTQVHLFWAHPALVGLTGGMLYYVVDAIAVAVLAYDTLLRVRLQYRAPEGPLADVVELRPGARVRSRSHHAA